MASKRSHHPRGLCAVALVAVSASSVFAQAATPAPADAAKPADGPVMTMLRLKDNTLLAGYIVREDDEVIVFNAGVLGEITIKKSEVDTQVASTVSAMPEKLLDELTLEEIADLFAYLESVPK